MDPIEPGPPPTDDTRAAEANAPEPLPSLPMRLVLVFVSPGKLMDGLAREPKWAAALLLGAVVVMISAALLPAELILDAQRQTLLERGQDMPEIPESAMGMIRIASVIAPTVFWFVMSFGVAGIYTILFAFILGDEGRYKQYLAVLTHAWFIAALAGLAYTPLRISTENLQFKVNLGSFLFFMPEGYFANVLQALELSQIWSTFVFAIGAHAIYRRRSVTSAFAIGFILVLALALVAARFM